MKEFNRVLVLLFFHLPLGYGQLFAFTLSGNSGNLRGWPGGEVKFFVNTNNCPAGVDIVGAVKEALEVWNAVPHSSLKVSYGGETSATSSTNPPTIYCEPNFASVTGASEDSVPAAASINTAGDVINTGFLVINASSGRSNIATLSPTALVVVMTHELGHVLGLGHSQTPNAVMYYTYSYKTEMRLAQDDIDGISYLYPSDEFADNQIAGCGRIEKPKPLSGIPQISWFAFSILAPIVIYFWLRRRMLTQLRQS